MAPFFLIVLSEQYGEILLCDAFSLFILCAKCVGVSAGHSVRIRWRNQVHQVQEW